MSMEERPTQSASTNLCVNCGAEINKNDGFCSKCGVKAEVSSETTKGTPMKTSVEQSAKKNQSEKIRDIAIVLLVVIIAFILSTIETPFSRIDILDTQRYLIDNFGIFGTIYLGIGIIAVLLAAILVVIRKKKDG